MIGKLVKGSGSRGLCEYLLAVKDHNGEERPRHEVIGGSLSGTTPRQLAAEFGALHRLRPKLGQYIAHMSLSLPPGERELSDDEWCDIAAHWTAGMGFQAYAVVSHGQHIHIAASRINLDNSVVSDSHDYRRSEALIREIEDKWHLTKVEASHLLEPERAGSHRRAPSLAQIAMAERGAVSPALQLQQLIDAQLADKISASDFVAGLEAAGVSVRPNIATTGKLHGFSYELDGIVLTSKALGRSYTLANLQKRGLSYDANRDLAALRGARDRAANVVNQRPDRITDGADGRNPDGSSVSESGPQDSGPRVAAGGEAGRGHGKPTDGESVEARRPGRPHRAAASASADAGKPVAVRAGGHRNDNRGDGVSGLEAEAFIDAEIAIADQDERTARRKRHLAALLREHYDSSWLPESAVAQITFVRLDPRRGTATIGFRDGSHLIDYGDRIALFGRWTSVAINELAEAAVRHGWKAVEVSGSQSFKDELTIALRLRGVEVVNHTLSGEAQRRLWEELAKRGDPAAIAALKRAEEADQRRKEEERRWLENEGRQGYGYSLEKMAEVVAADAPTTEPDSTPPVTSPAADQPSAPDPVSAPKPARGGMMQQPADLAGTTAAEKRLARVRAQMAAMGSDIRSWEIGVLPPKDGPADLRPEATRTWTTAEVQDPKKLAWLAQRNSQGYDIYIRPARIPKGDGSFLCYPLAMLDDLKREAVDKLAADGVASVVETSPGNFQAWVRLAPPGELVAEDELFHALRILATEYESDPGAVSRRRYGRLAGFTNQKPKRKKADGHQPYCVLHEHTGAEATNGYTVLEWARRALVAEKQEAAEKKAEAARTVLSAIEFSSPEAFKDAVEAFAAARSRMTSAKDDGSPDDSARDFGACVRLMQRYHPDQVAAALRQSSPKAARKRGQNLEDYIRLTVERAEAEWRRQQAARTAGLRRG